MPKIKFTRSNHVHIPNWMHKSGYLHPRYFDNDTVNNMKCAIKTPFNYSATSFTAVSNRQKKRRALCVHTLYASANRQQFLHSFPIIWTGCTAINGRRFPYKCYVWQVVDRFVFNVRCNGCASLDAYDYSASFPRCRRIH